jgi:hypothetical protein
MTFLLKHFELLPPPTPPSLLQIKKTILTEFSQETQVSHIKKFSWPFCWNILNFYHPPPPHINIATKIWLLTLSALTPKHILRKNTTNYITVYPLIYFGFLFCDYTELKNHLLLCLNIPHKRLFYVNLCNVFLYLNFKDFYDFELL